MKTSFDLKKQNYYIEETKISGLTVYKTVTRLTFKDTLGLWRVRLGIRRNSYMVKPGIYCTGNPGKDSLVFVSANYKLSFDTP